MRRAGDGQAIAATVAPSKVASAPNAPEVSAPNVSSTSFVPASLKKNSFGIACPVNVTSCGGREADFHAFCFRC